MIRRSLRPPAAPPARRPGLAFALLLPAPVLGTAAGMWWWPDTRFGQVLFFAAKLWILALPLWWHVKVDRGRWGRSACGRAGWWAGVRSGILFAAVIGVAYRWAGYGFMDADETAALLRGVGLNRWWILVGMGLYWSTVNAVLEEMVWRWFALRQARALVPRAGWAAPTAALGFTLHHVVALAAWLPAPATVIASMGIFVAGFVWGRMTLRYRSVLPACVSHIIADLAIFTAAGHLLFAR